MKVAVLDDYANVATQFASFDQIEATDVVVFNDTITEHNAPSSTLGTV